MLQAIVEESGARLSEEDLRPDHFGSYWSIYVHGENRARLVWDGKEGWGFLQRFSEPNRQWEQVAPLVTESDIEGTPQNEIVLTQFRQAIKNLLVPANEQ